MRRAHAARTGRNEHGGGEAHLSSARCNWAATTWNGAPRDGDAGYAIEDQLAGQKSPPSAARGRPRSHGPRRPRAPTLQEQPTHTTMYYFYRVVCYGVTPAAPKRISSQLDWLVHAVASPLAPRRGRASGSYEKGGTRALGLRSAILPSRNRHLARGGGRCRQTTCDRARRRLARTQWDVACPR